MAFQNLRKKKLYGWGGFTFVFLHFLAIVIYAMPGGILPKRIVKVSVFYVEPLFQQKWNMFAPCPVLSHHTEIKYYFEGGDTTGWISPSEEAVSKHMYLRGSHHGDIALAEYNLLYWVEAAIKKLELENNVDVPDEKRSKFKSDIAYYLARNYAYGNAVYLLDKKPYKAIMKCYFFNVKTGKNHELVLPELIWKTK